jgi:hypothetical protein
MGLKVYDPRPEKKDWFWWKMFILWMVLTAIINVGWSTGIWLRTGVWHW